MTPCPSPTLYLNHAGTSFPKPPAVIQAITGALQAGPKDYRSIFSAAASVVASRLGVETERLLFTTGCSQALEVALLSLPWNAGDIVLTSQLEHQAVMAPLQTLERLVGVEVIKAPYSPGAPLDLEFVKKALRKGRVRLIACSVVSNITGERLPIEAVSKLAHDYGALVLADAAQSFGLFDDTAGSLSCDLLTFAGHKFPLGPQGIGGLWCRPGVEFASKQAMCELGNKAAQCSTPMPGYCEVGGVNVPGLAGLAAGLSAFGTERAAHMQRARQLAATFAEQARGIKRVRVFGYHGGPQGAVVSCLHQSLRLDAAEEHFLKQGIRIRAGTHCASDALTAIGAPEGTLRISFGPESTNQDVQRMVRNLERVPA